MAATGLVDWANLMGFTGHPGLARWEIATFTGCCKSPPASHAAPDD